MVPNEDFIRNDYEIWRTQFEKGDFDKDRYDIFKSNYLTLIGVNSDAIQKAISEGRPLPPLWFLNIYGDCTKAEYELRSRRRQTGTTITTDTTATTTTLPSVEVVKMPPSSATVETETNRAPETTNGSSNMMVRSMGIVSSVKEPIIDVFPRRISFGIFNLSFFFSRQLLSIDCDLSTLNGVSIMENQSTRQGTKCLKNITRRLRITLRQRGMKSSSTNMQT